MRSGAHRCGGTNGYKRLIACVCVCVCVCKCGVLCKDARYVCGRA